MKDNINMDSRIALSEYSWFTDYYIRRWNLS